MSKKSAVLIFAAVCLFALPHLLYLRPLIVLSGSMEPALHTGSLIFIDTKKTVPRPGDIITISLPTEGQQKMLITHRLIREEDGMLITKGDANKTEDLTRVRQESVVGTFVFQIPYAGYFIEGMRGCLSRILLIFTGKHTFSTGSGSRGRKYIIRKERRAERHLLLTLCERCYEKTQRKIQTCSYGRGLCPYGSHDGRRHYGLSHR